MSKNYEVSTEKLAAIFYDTVRDFGPLPIEDYMESPDRVFGGFLNKVQETNRLEKWICALFFLKAKSEAGEPVETITLSNVNVEVDRKTLIVILKRLNSDGVFLRAWMTLYRFQFRDMMVQTSTEKEGE